MVTIVDLFIIINPIVLAILGYKFNQWLKKDDENRKFKADQEQALQSFTEIMQMLHDVIELGFELRDQNNEGKQLIKKIVDLQINWNQKITIFEIRLRNITELTHEDEDFIEQFEAAFPLLSFYTTLIPIIASDQDIRNDLTKDMYNMFFEELAKIMKMQKRLKEILTRHLVKNKVENDEEDEY